MLLYFAFNVQAECSSPVSEYSSVFTTTHYEMPEQTLYSPTSLFACALSSMTLRLWFIVAGSLSFR